VVAFESYLPGTPSWVDLSSLVRFAVLSDPTGAVFAVITMNAG
jgi:hypothetical protein